MVLNKFIAYNTLTNFLLREQTGFAAVLWRLRQCVSCNYWRIKPLEEIVLKIWKKRMLRLWKERELLCNFLSIVRITIICIEKNVYLPRSEFFMPENAILQLSSCFIFSYLPRKEISRLFSLKWWQRVVLISSIF